MPIKVLVKQLAQPAFDMEIENEMSILGVKEQLEELLSINVAQQKLVFKGNHSNLLTLRQNIEEHRFSIRS